MTSLRQTLEERLLTIFSTHYDIERGSDDSALKACCAFHSRDSQYVLSKKAELWAGGSTTSTSTSIPCLS